VKKLFFNKGLIRIGSFGKGLEFEFCNFGKGLLPFWASRGCSGTACCNSEPSKQTYSDRDAFTGSDREMSKNLTELQRFCGKKMPLSNYMFFQKKRVLPILFCHKSEPSKQYMSFRIIWKNCHNSDPSY